MQHDDPIGIDTSVPIETLSLQIERMRRLGSEEGAGPRYGKAVQRLGFVLLRYKGYSVREASEIIGVSVQTGYNWQNAWNRSKLDSVMPNYNGGRRSMLSDDQKSSLRRIVAETSPTTSEAAEMIEEAFGIRYTEKQVHIILRSMGFDHRSLPSLPGSPDHRRRMRWMMPASGADPVDR